MIKEKTAAERHVDSWGKEGAGGRWTRIHRSARRSLFTPYKVVGGPGSKAPLKKIRITRGKYVGSGKSFKIIDDWSIRANAHRLLQAAWIGTTDFRETSEFVDDDSDEEEDKNDYEEEVVKEQELGEAVPAATPTEEAEAQGGAQYFNLSPTKGVDTASETSLFSAPARLSIVIPSASLRGHEAEGECENDAAFTRCSLAGPQAARLEAGVHRPDARAHFKCEGKSGESRGRT